MQDALFIAAANAYKPGDCGTRAGLTADEWGYFVRARRARASEARWQGPGCRGLRRSLWSSGLQGCKHERAVSGRLLGQDSSPITRS